MTRVLLVDDDEQIRLFFGRVLRTAGYHTVVACDAIEAAGAAMVDGPFDVLLTDLVMPEVDGQELARRMRHAQPDLPVLYVTGYSDRLFAQRHVLSDGEAFLDKTCTPLGLLQAVGMLAPLAA
jgi:CheY-like chemotaxis protein